MTRAVLSAGSNVGDRQALLRGVVDGFADDVVAVSQMYATAPWGVLDQADFYNITLIVAGDRAPHEWLRIGAELEQAAHRTRAVRWGPRTLDVDVISVSDDAGVVVSDDPELTLPHPRAAVRAFVLAPWLEIEPEATLWTSDGPRRVADLLAALPAADRDGVRALGPVIGAQSALGDPTQ